jgi:hypothetical protein
MEQVKKVKNLQLNTLTGHLAVENQRGGCQVMGWFQVNGWPLGGVVWHGLGSHISVHITACLSQYFSLIFSYHSNTTMEYSNGMYWQNDWT